LEQIQASLKDVFTLEVVSLMALLIVARALREIKYYQSQARAEVLELPRAPFKRTVMEIALALFGKRYRWEADAITAMQTMTEHILTMIFEMLYLRCILY
jgi:histone H3/H4